MKKPRKPQGAKQSQPAPSPEPHPARSWGALVCLLAGLASSAALVTQHFGAISLPGCGIGSACDQAAKSPAGSIPILGWPVSFLGATYFTAMLVAFIVGGRKLGTFPKALSLLAALISIGYAGIMVAKSLPCTFCIIIHISAITFALLIWLPGRTLSLASNPSGTARWQPLLFTLSLLSIFAGLGFAHTAAADAAAKSAEADLAKATIAISQGQYSIEPSPATADSPAPTTRFEGRYRKGPERAAVRIVMFTDYQCPDCKILERQLADAMRASPRVAASIKYFPLSASCNEHAPGEMHANACWAARAAETAGILGGTDGFWRMHEWLFTRGGSFTDDELNTALPALGFNPADFVRIMQTDETLARVKADVAEAMSLGIYNTPMIFINGVELKGWTAPDALGRAVRAALSNTSIIEATNEGDTPPTAAARMIADWRDQTMTAFPADALQRPLGKSSAPVTVVLFGDYLEKFTAEADGLIRVFTDGPEPNVRYHFIHYPVNQACNPLAQMTLNQASCTAHRAAEAADVLDGAEGYWRMHQYIMANQATFSESELRAAASTLGFDPDVLLEAMSQPFITERLEARAQLAQSIGLKAIPMVFVNGKHVPRWKAEHENILPRIFMEAAQTSPTSSLPR